VLRRPAGPVDPADLRDGQLAELIARMRVTMEMAPGVGLAAPQISEPIQLAVLADDPEH
jgi:peptide deformylase